MGGACTAGGGQLCVCVCAGALPTGGVRLAATRVRAGFEGRRKLVAGRFVSGRLFVAVCFAGAFVLHARRVAVLLAQKDECESLAGAAGRQVADVRCFPFRKTAGASGIVIAWGRPASLFPPPPKPSRAGSRTGPRVVCSSSPRPLLFAAPAPSPLLAFAGCLLSSASWPPVRPPPANTLLVRAACAAS